MKKVICLLIVISLYVASFAQTHIDQMGLKTSVTNLLPANGLQALRYEVASIGYNSYHWQFGGLIVVELFSNTFATGYEKYIIENGHGQGTTGTSPVIRHTESYGNAHNAKIMLGESYYLGSESGGYLNKVLPVYLDVRFHSAYKVRLTYLQDLVEVVNGLNQIKINTNPTSIAISDFLVPSIAGNNVETTGNLMISGNGNHYIQNGNLGIGTINPSEKLSVNGKIHAQEIKVETANWPDYVFADDYKLRSLPELEAFISKYKHLPEIASAKVMQQNGLEVGNFQTQLLQKIEEMTLYLIEMEKQLTNQISINRQFEDRLLKLEKPTKKKI